MNFKEYAEQAVTIEEIPMGPHKGTPISEAAGIAINRGYPTRQPGGVYIIQGPRGTNTNQIDNQAKHLRCWLAAIMESVVEDCISIVESQDTTDKAVKALRDHFKMNVN